MALILPSEGKVFRKDVYFRETDYTPHNGQKAVHYNSTRHRALSNGRRWGKTQLGGKEVEGEAFVKNFLGKPKIGWIIGPEYSDCEKEFRVLYNTFKALGIDQISSKFLNNTENGNMRIKTNWGFDVQCRSARHPDSLVGEGLDFVLMVEAGRLHRRTFTEYVRPALSDKRGWSMMTGVPEITTDTSLLFWAYERGQDPSREQWMSWQRPSWENSFVFPGGRNDPEIIEAEDDLTDDEFKRQYGGEFVERVGRVMSEWDDQLHVSNAPSYDPKLPLFMALDYGYTNDWVCLWIQTDVFNNVYVVKESRWRLKDTDEVCDAILADEDLRTLLSKVVAIYAPPAEPSDTNIVRRRLDKPVKINTGGEIKTRDGLTRKFLKAHPADLPDGHPEKRARLQVHRSCTKLRWEMKTGYRWPENKSENRSDSENPMDKDNHGPEALGRFMKGHMERFEPTRHGRQSRIRSGRRTAHGSTSR